MSMTILLLSRVLDSERVKLEDLRALEERLPGAFTVAAAAMDLPPAQFKSLVESGGLTASEFIPRFAAEIDRMRGTTARVLN